MRKIRRRTDASFEKKGRESWYPRKGDAEDLFRRLAEYISKFDTEWVKNIRPTSKEKIEQLVEKSGIREFDRTLPKEYQVYLEHMGEEDGGLFEYLDGPGSANIDEIIDRYQCVFYDPLQDPEEIRKRPFYIIFFLNVLCVETSIDLRGEPPYKIVNTGSFRIGSTMAESFEKLLFQSAFREFEIYGNPYYCRIGVPGVKVEVTKQEQKVAYIFELVDDIVKKYRLEKAWFSDFRHYIALGRQVSFCIDYLIIGSYEEPFSSHFIDVRITGKNRKWVKKVGDTLMETLNGKIDKNFYHM